MGLIHTHYCIFPGGPDGKASACSAEDWSSIPGSGRSPGEGNGYPLTGSLPAESHGQRSLVGCSPWGLKELDTTEQLALSHSLQPLRLPGCGYHHCPLHTTIQSIPGILLGFIRQTSHTYSDVTSERSPGQKGSIFRNMTWNCVLFSEISCLLFKV